jgi:hypothetical protein
VAEHAVAHRHGEAGAEVAHLGARGQAVGRLEADGPHPAVADLLGDLGPHATCLAVDRDGHLEALLMAGTASGGNSTSTTGPAMATTRAVLRASAPCRCWCR